jgi:membrane protein implicated in regulation of membrane protease activity
MKSFFDWLLLAGMAAIALFAAAGDWLPVIQTRLSALRMAAVAGGGVDWTMVGGAIFLVVVLVIYSKAGKDSHG